MPRTKVSVYCGADGKSELLTWLKALKKKVPASHKKAQARFRLLALQGNKLRRPVVGYLRDGIIEFRWDVGRVNYRVLYFFHGRDEATLSHGFTKERFVPEHAIEMAIAHKQDVIRDPDKYTVTFEV